MSEAADRLVVFTPSGKRGRFAEDTNLLDAARSLGVDLDSVCGGRGICGRCQIVVSEGEFAKHGIVSAADHLTPFSEPEQRYRDLRGLAPERRLGCHARLRGDLVVDVPPESQVHRQLVRKEADAHAIEVDPVVRLHYVEVREPDLADPSGDLQRLLEAPRARLVPHGPADGPARPAGAAAVPARGRLDRDGRRARGRTGR